MRQQLCWSTFVIGALLVFVFTEGGAPARAQSPATAPTTTPAQPAQVNVQNLPPGTMLPPGTVGAPRTVLPPGASQQAAPVDEACDYWIVSSRHCSGRASGNLGCMQFFHR